MKKSRLGRVILKKKKIRGSFGPGLTVEGTENYQEKVGERCV